jgi:hypothetical protein
MKCPACNREIGYRPPGKDGKPEIVRCPNTGQVVTLAAAPR